MPAQISLGQSVPATPGTFVVKTNDYATLQIFTPAAGAGPNLTVNIQNLDGTKGPALLAWKVNAAGIGTPASQATGAIYDQVATSFDVSGLFNVVITNASGAAIIFDYGLSDSKLNIPVSATVSGTITVTPATGAEFTTMESEATPGTFGPLMSPDLVHLDTSESDIGYVTAANLVANNTNIGFNTFKISQKIRVSIDFSNGWTAGWVQFQDQFPGNTQHAIFDHTGTPINSDQVNQQGQITFAQAQILAVQQRGVGATFVDIYLDGTLTNGFIITAFGGFVGNINVYAYGGRFGGISLDTSRGRRFEWVKQTITIGPAGAPTPTTIYNKPKNASGFRLYYNINTTATAAGSIQTQPINPLTGTAWNTSGNIDSFGGSAVNVQRNFVFQVGTSNLPFGETTVLDAAVPNQFQFLLSNTTGLGTVTVDFYLEWLYSG